MTPGKTSQRPPDPLPVHLPGGLCFLVLGPIFVVMAMKQADEILEPIEFALIG